MAAGVGGRLVDRVAAVGGRDGLLPLGSAACQILHRQQAALLLAEADDGAGDLALVEDAVALGGDALEGAGKVALVQHLPRRKGASVAGEDGARGGELAQEGVGGDGGGEGVGHREAVVGKVDGGLQHLGQG